MKLTLEEIGAAELHKAHGDAQDCRYTPSLALRYATDWGTRCAVELQSFKDGVRERRSERTKDRHAADAMTFARLALRGWRAYRVMTDEETVIEGRPGCYLRRRREGWAYYCSACDDFVALAGNYHTDPPHECHP